MIVEIKKLARGKYVADCPELPGSPPVGHGRSKLSATADLLASLFLSKEDWSRFVKDKTTVNVVSKKED